VKDRIIVWGRNLTTQFWFCTVSLSHQMCLIHS